MREGVGIRAETRCKMMHGRGKGENKASGRLEKGSKMILVTHEGKKEAETRLMVRARPRK